MFVAEEAFGQNNDCILRKQPGHRYNVNMPAGPSSDASVLVPSGAERLKAKAWKIGNRTNPSSIDTPHIFSSDSFEQFGKDRRGIENCLSDFPRSAGMM